MYATSLPFRLPILTLSSLKSEESNPPPKVLKHQTIPNKTHLAYLHPLLRTPYGVHVQYTYVDHDALDPPLLQQQQR